ncbi:recombinase family protein [Ruficoccus amylovorans]|uniref:Recombinase family protein n=1 Tax=Ruficoccus amylovorans TaxID=1804625 RepID=A0A842HB76_9BACT|nr:recombinase family protein [Ruficoccus amylovorans]MBC2593530.1 recombinase family protein [Ruficoccus amylovorans]
MIAPASTKPLRCAIYTRKSVDEGLDQDMNSLTVQREAGEAYIKSQKGEGWLCLPDPYDDGGYSGGNMQRPGLQRLLVDIRLGGIDCVLVYKVDRLSRSLLDFAKLIECFDQHDVIFVSVTQPISTSTSLGRLTLGILISFAQFEREQISERTKDRMASARRKGRWVGGRPLLGYDVSREERALVVNELEAQQVRRMFELYLKERSLTRTVACLQEEGICLKRWVTRSGNSSGGGPINKNGLHRLLSNVAYVGKVCYEGETVEGAHEAIVTEEVFEAVQHQLKANDRNGGVRVRNKHDALLRGLLTCRHCGTAMTHTFSSKKSDKVYRYYVCQRAMKESWSVCPSKSVVAGEIEAFVVERIRGLGSDPALQEEVIDAFLSRQSKARKLCEKDLANMQKQYRKLQQEIQHAIERQMGAAEFSLLEDKRKVCELALQSISVRLERLQGNCLNRNGIIRALSLFHPVWEKLTTPERCDLLGLLIERIAYDGEAGEVEIIWKEEGIHALLENE